MPQPVKLSDPLVNAARDAATSAHRSLAAQIEHWATLGRAIDGQLTSHQTAELVRGVREAHATYSAPVGPDIAERIDTLLQDIRDGSFSRAARDTLHAGPTPIYGTHPDHPGKLVRRDPDGTLTPGRLTNRKFVADDADEARATL